MKTKFQITRTDGTPLPETAKFFVLRLDDHEGPDNLACRAALTMYVREAWDVDPDAAKAAHDLLMQTQAQ